MTKSEFLLELRDRLKNYPQAEIEKTVAYYDEIINDRVEDGMQEEEAVEVLGNIDNIVSSIISSMSLPTILKTRIKNDRKFLGGPKWVWILIAVLGFPLWFPLTIAAGSVLFSLFIAIWSLIFSLFAVVAGLTFSSFMLLIGGIFNICTGNVASGLFSVGASFVYMGLVLFAYKPILLAVKQIIKGTSYLWKKIKLIFVKGETQND